jgi:hypothetical protein
MNEPPIHGKTHKKEIYQQRHKIDYWLLVAESTEVVMLLVMNEKNPKIDCGKYPKN